MAELVKPKPTRKKHRNSKPCAARPLVAASIDEEIFPDVGEDILETTVGPSEEEACGEADGSCSEVIADSDVPGEPDSLELKKPSSTESRNNGETTATAITVEGNSTFYAVKSPYTDLVRDLEKCVNEISVPTAPLVVATPEVVSTKSSNHVVVTEEEVSGEEGTLMKDMVDGLNLEEEIVLDVIPFSEKDLSQIYKNEELEASVLFVEEFSKNHKPDEDELFALLTEYVKLRKNNRENEKELDCLTSDFQRCEKELWSVWPNVVMTERGKCRDMNDVILKHSYQQARFNKSACHKFQELLARTKQHATKEQWPNEVAVRLCKLSVEALLWDIQHCCTAFTEYNNPSFSTPTDTFTKKCIERLSKAVAVLFYFLRTIPAEEDEEFVVEAKAWLSGLVALLTKVGSWQEQLFILSHVLRCPPTVASWAASFIQCPPRAADHACTLLAVLLQPVTQREAFLQDRLESGPWVLLDDDGEDDSVDLGVVTENVLFRLLTQVPLQELLQQYLLTDRTLMNEMTVIQLFAFFSSLVEILLCGLLTYSGEEHRQFGKRLGKLVRELLELATDELELFVGESLPSPRLQAEYDAFLLRGARALLAASPVWQFLAAAPFHRASGPARWRLYLDLVFAKGSIVTQADFASRLASLPDAEQCHLLSTLCNLALAPGQSSNKLVRAVAVQIFYVGFVSPATRDIAYKNAKSLLASICNTHTYLLSEFVEVYNRFIETGELDEECCPVELWQALPVTGWIPSDADVATLVSWLSEPISSQRCEMARCILRMLDYSVIGRSAQMAIARAVVRASRDISASEVAFSQFIWTLLCQLRLHVVECEDISLRDVPNLGEDAELGLLIAQNVSAASFLALKSTSAGHFVPVIYAHGFKMVRTLFNERHHEAAFSCIDYMATMFWDCPDSLVSCQDFLALLGDVVVADETYMKMAKSLIVNDRPGPILRKFASMLHAHLARSGFETLVRAVDLWVRSLTSLPMWQHCAGAVYLVDVVCRRAFSHPAAWLQVQAGLEAALQVTATPEPRSPLSSFLRLGGAPAVPTLLPRCCNGSVPWFAYAAISVEFELFEKRTSLWSELLRELWNGRSKKTSVDGTLKKVCTNLKLPVRTSGQLAFYRWCAQALEMPEAHPLNILVWEKILGLYMSRVPGLVDRGSPGACFFHGVTNTGLLKRLKERLENLSSAQPYLATTFRTLALWLTEPTVLEPSLLVAALPAQYNAPLLAALLSGENHLWFSLLPLARMRDDLTKDAVAWSSVLGRVRKPPSFSSSKVPESPEQRILQRLVGFGIPAPLPAVVPISAVLPKISLLSDKHRLLLEYLYPAHLRVDNFLSQCKKQMKDLCTFEAAILRSAGQLYTSQQTEKKLSERCEGVVNEQTNVRRACSGPAELIIKYVQWTHDFKTQSIFDENMDKLRRALRGIIVACDVIQSCLLLEHVADLFVEESLRTSDLDSALFAVGLEFFGKLLNLWQCAEGLYPVIAELLERSILKIGKSCIEDRPDQSLELLKYIFEVPSAKFLHHLFNPNACSGEEFVTMYKLTLQKSSDSSLLSRFNIVRWLESAQVKSVTRSKLLAVLFSGLRNPPSVPDGDPSTSKVLNEHLQLLTLHQFPEHYGEILKELVNHLDPVSPETWHAFINALAPGGLALSPGTDSLSPKSIVAFISRFAAEQTLLPCSVLQDTIGLLGGKWRDQRLQDGSLYPSYRCCAEPLLTFLGVVFQSMVVRLLADRHGLLSAQVVDMVWPMLEDVFTPWLVPYIFAGNTLQQPFRDEDAALAGFAATIFTECVRFLALSLSGPEVVMSHALRFYTKYFCLEGVEGLVLSTIHSSLVTLPWSAMSPTLQDVEAMLQVVNVYVPLCHGFLGNVFVSVDWTLVVRRSLTAFGSELNARLHACLLHLLVKFPYEPSLKMNKAVKHLVESSAGFAWHLVDAGGYGSIVTWFTCNCHADVVLDDPVSDYHELDTRVLRLLQVAAGYDAGIQYFHPTTPAKRQMFVAAVVKCLATAATKRKRDSKTINKIVSNILNDIETIVTATVPEHFRVDEAAVLLTEVLRLLTESKLVGDVEQSLAMWLAAGRATLVSTALFRCAGAIVDNPVLYGTLIEVAIESQFADAGVRHWQNVAHALMPYAGGTVPMDQVLISNGCFLTLYALTLQRLRAEQPAADSRPVLTMLLQMFATVKPCDDSESKLLLLVGLAVMLTANQPDAASVLQTLGDSVSALAADRGSGFLSTIGFKKATSPSVKMKLCCLTAAAGISNILLSEYNHVSDDKSMQSLQRAESNKQFVPVMPHLISIRRDLPNVKQHAQLVSLLYATAAQLFNKLYFVF